MNGRAIAWRGADPERGYLNIDRISLLDDAMGVAYPVAPLTTLELASAR